MPDGDKVAHISFSARDNDQRAEWFTRVRGFSVFDEVAGADWRGVLLLYAGSGTVIQFQQFDQDQGKEFDPRRTGLDHIGLKAGSPDVLKQWQEHFEALNIDYTPIADRDHGPGFALRDPDGHQFEMFYRADHPLAGRTADRPVLRGRDRST